MSGAVVAAADAKAVLAAAPRSAAAAIPGVPGVAAAAAAVSAVGWSVAGVLVGRGADVAAAAAEPQARPAASARGRCFAGDSALTSPARPQVFSCPVGNLR